MISYEFLHLSLPLASLDTDLQSSTVGVVLFINSPVLTRLMTCDNNMCRVDTDVNSCAGILNVCGTILLSLHGTEATEEGHGCDILCERRQFGFQGLPSDGIIKRHTVPTLHYVKVLSERYGRQAV